MSSKRFTSRKDEAHEVFQTAKEMFPALSVTDFNLKGYYGLGFVKDSMDKAVAFEMDEHYESALAEYRNAVHGIYGSQVNFIRDFIKVCDGILFPLLRDDGVPAYLYEEGREIRNDLATATGQNKVDLVESSRLYKSFLEYLKELDKRIDDYFEEQDIIDR